MSNGVLPAWHIVGNSSASNGIGKDAPIGDILAGAAGSASGIVKLTASVPSLVAAPTGAIVGTTDIQALTNKAVSASTVTGLPAPVVGSDATTKSYVDSIAAGLHIHPAVNLATTGVLSGSPTYSNGASGVGATLAATVNGALTVDSVLAVNGNRVLVKDQGSSFQNGAYDVTGAGSGGSTYLLTRAVDMDTAAEMAGGDSVSVLAGTLNVNTIWVLTTPVATVGTSAVVFAQYGTGGGNQWVTSASNIINNNAGSVGIGTASPLYKLDIIGSAAITQFHVGDTADKGTYLMGVGGLGYFQTNATFNGSNWIAKDTAATIILSSGGGTFFYGNTGLTPAGSFTPTLRGAFNASGDLSVTNFGNYGIPAIGTGGVLTQAKAAVIAPGVSGVPLTGADDATAAINAILALSDNVIFYPGTYRIGQNSSWPSGKTYEVCNGAAIAVDNGLTLTIGGVVYSGQSHIFTGLGTVKGLKFNRPEWWGAVNNGITNDLIALQAAHDSAEASSGSDGDRPTVQLTNGGGYFTSGIWFLRPQVSFPLRVTGSSSVNSNTSTILAGTGATTAIWVRPQAGQTIVDFELSNFAIVNQTASHDYIGLLIGENGGNFVGLMPGGLLVTNINIVGFGTGIKLTGVRLLEINRTNITTSSVLSGAIGMRLEPGENNQRANVGDNTFRDVYVQTTLDMSHVGIDLRAAAGSQSGIQSNVFDRVTVYNAGTMVRMFADLSSNIANTWFNAFEFEGQAGGHNQTALTAQATAGCLIYRTHFTDLYVNAIDNAAFQFTGVNYNIRATTFQGCSFQSFSSRIVSAAGVWGFAFNNNNIQDLSGATEAMYFLDVKNVVVSNNNFYITAGSPISYAVTFDGAGSYLRVIGNTCGSMVSIGPVHDLRSSGSDPTIGAGSTFNAGGTFVYNG